jgi:two-component system sensor histidine kinase KdpD
VLVLRLPRWLLRPLTGVGISTLFLAALTGMLAPLLDERQLVAVALLYLLLTLVASAVWGYVVGLVTALVSNLLLNFFFVSPLHRFTVQRPENVAALLVFLAVAAVGASMLALLRRQVAVALAGRTEARTLLDVNQAVTRAATPDEALTALCRAVASAIGAGECGIVRDLVGWRAIAGSWDAGQPARLMPVEEEVAAQAVDTRSITRLPDSARTFVPFPAESPERAVLRIVGRIQAPPLVDQERLMHAFAGQASVALHRAELAEEARRAQALQEADAFKATLLSSVSHDLRSPLTAIKAAVGSLRDHEVQWSPEDVEGFIETIESQTDRLTAVVSDLLEMSRLEGGAARVTLEPVQVAPFLAEVARAHAVSARDRRVTVEAHPALWVRTDYALMMQALGNLVENATRYSVPRGVIRLVAERSAPDRIAIRVIDEGPGIPEEDLPHVFEKFYRGVQTRKSRGTGLGLAITKAMVELCDGSIGVRSSLQGTEFTMLLPAAEAPK